MVITVLSLPGGVVQAFLCHQTLMRAALGDASVIEIQDLIGILYGAVTGRLAEVTDAALSCAKEAVALCIAMSGIVAMWMGIMQIARSSGLIDKMTEKMQPLLHFLFPKIPKEHPAMEYISANVIANFF